jgi:hypothetical protein
MWSILNLRKLAALLIVTYFLVPMPCAQADEMWDGIQIDCVPSLDHFSLRTMVFDEEAPKRDEGAASLRNEKHIFGSQYLLKHPFKCELPARSISVSVENFEPGSASPGECALSDHFNLAIGVNGTQIYKFSAYGFNRCENPEAHLVDLDHFNFMTACTLPTGSSIQAPAECKLTKVQMRLPQPNK